MGFLKVNIGGQWVIYPTKKKVGNDWEWRPFGEIFSGILDTYSGATCAYSLRHLTSVYTGYCIEVRRSSDNTTQNIGFVNHVLDIASLLTFCGAGDGFVRTWYDQSGNGNNATSTVNNAYQPKIVSSGAMVTYNGWNSMFFDATDDRMITGVTVNKPYSFFTTFSQLSGGLRVITETSGLNCLISSCRPSYVVYNQGTIVYGNYAVSKEPVSISLIAGSSNSKFYYDGRDITVSNYNNNWGPLCFGAANPYGEVANAYMNEFIYYAADKTSDRTGIEANIREYYSPYSYDDAVSIYSVRKVRSSYSGYCIEVRRSSDNTTQNIGFSGNDLDTTSLLAFVGAGSGYVKTWYDQSVSANNAVQTTDANQPRIVNTGTVDTDGSKPAVYFGGSAWFNISTPLTLPSASSVFTVQKRTSGFMLVFGNNTAHSPYSAFQYNNGWVYMATGTNYGYATDSSTARNLHSWFQDSNMLNVAFLNMVNKLLVNNGATGGNTFHYIGRRSATEISTGYIQEGIILPSNVIMRHFDIESEINAYYSVY